MQTEARRSRARLRGLPASVSWVVPVLLGLAVLEVLERSRLAVLEPVGGKLQTLMTVFLGIFVEAFPFLMLGVVASAAIHLFVSDALLDRLLPRQAVPAALVGAFLGLVFPVCECGVVPVSRRLLRKGAPLPLAIAFMLAGPVINPVVIASTWIAFGTTPQVAFGRFGLVVAVAVIVALVFSLHPDQARVLTQLAQPQSCDLHDHGRAQDPGEVSASTHVPEGLVEGVGRLLRESAGELFEMGRYLVGGALIAATLQTFVSRSSLAALGQDPALSIIALMALAVLLSICSTVDAFVALTFAGTFTSGAIVAFLAFGPMVDLKSTLMYTTTLRRAPVLLLVVLCAQLVFLAALFLNLNLGWG